MQAPMETIAVITNPRSRNAFLKIGGETTHGLNLRTSLCIMSLTRGGFQTRGRVSAGRAARLVSPQGRAASTLDLRPSPFALVVHNRG